MRVNQLIELLQEIVKATPHRGEWEIASEHVGDVTEGVRIDEARQELTIRHTERYTTKTGDRRA